MSVHSAALAESEEPAHPGPEPASEPVAGGWKRGLGIFEEGALGVFLVALMGLPLLEIALRILGTGLPGSTTLVQHLTFLVGMAGAALAAREGRLLALATGTFLPKGRLREGARWWAGAGGGAVAALLAAGGARFVAMEASAGTASVAGIPLWGIQLALPVGFSLIAFRLAWGAASRTGWRAAACAVVALAAWAGTSGEALPGPLLVPLLAVLVLGAAAGVPLFAVLGGSALLLFWSEGLPIAVLSVDHYRLVTSPTLPAIPLFTLAGFFLARGGASRRLMLVFRGVFGRLRGGEAVAIVVVCAFFTAFTGASGVTILALGGLAAPLLTAARYSERDAVAIVTGAGSLGLLFPPCLPLILYAVVAKTGMETMFLAGLLPGLLLVGLAAGWSVWRSPPAVAAGAVGRGEIVAALWDAKWELLLPAVALGALFAGLATPVEAAAVTAAYAYVVEAWIYRDLSEPGALRAALAECGLLVGGVLLILGVALGLTNYLVDAQVPERLLDWATATIHSRWAFLLLLNVFLLVVGCLMDVFSAIAVVVPLIVPLGEAFGIHPAHLGIIFLANLELGYLTPPVGLNLFLASYRLGKPMTEVYRSVVPLLLVLAAGVLAITYLPFLSTTLPEWLGR